MTILVVGDEAQHTTSVLSVGTHTVHVDYSGDSNLTASSGDLSGDQAVDKADTTTVVASDDDTTTYGDTVTLTATVTADPPGTGTPSGTVEFFDGATSLGTASLDGSGVAELSMSSSARGVTRSRPSTSAPGRSTTARAQGSRRTSPRRRPQ